MNIVHLSSHFLISPFDSFSLVQILSLEMLGLYCFTIQPHMNLNQGSSPWWLGLTPHCLPEEVEPQRLPTDCLGWPQRLPPEGLEPHPLPPITKGALLVCGVSVGLLLGKTWKWGNCENTQITFFGRFLAKCGWVLVGWLIPKQGPK